MYKEPSDDDDDLVDSDEEADRLAADAEYYAVAEPEKSVYEKLLDQREGPPDAEGGPPTMEYLAKLRGKYVAARHPAPPPRATAVFPPPTSHRVAPH